MSNVDIMRDLVVNQVLLNSTITYGEIAKVIGIDLSRIDERKRFNQYTGEMNDQDYNAGIPIHSPAIVHSDGDGYGSRGGWPGKGFWVYVDKANLRIPGEDNDTVYIRLLAELYDYYGVK